ncbi:hypothetical protein FWC63_03185 [Candidatus Saccharibacteria bacterium]|nr:hypothetical protein [Candidatus Saccharibacteria bacterium]
MKRSKGLISAAVLGSTMIASQVAVSVTEAIRPNILELDVTSANAGGDIYSNIVVVHPEVALSAEAQELADEIKARLVEVRESLSQGVADAQAQAAATIDALEGLLEQLRTRVDNVDVEMAFERAIELAREQVMASAEVAARAMAENSPEAQAERIRVTTLLDNYASWAADLAANRQIIEAEVAEANVVLGNLPAAVQNAIIAAVPEAAVIFDGLDADELLADDEAIAVLQTIASVSPATCNILIFPALVADCTNALVRVGAVRTAVANYLDILELQGDFDEVAGFTGDREVFIAARVEVVVESMVSSLMITAELAFDALVASIQAEIIAAGETAQQSTVAAIAAVEARITAIRAQTRELIAALEVEAQSAWDAFLAKESGLSLRVTTTTESMPEAVWTGDLRSLTWGDIMKHDFAVEAKEIALDAELFPDCATSVVGFNHTLELVSDWKSGEKTLIDLNFSHTLPNVNIAEFVSDVRLQDLTSIDLGLVAGIAGVDVADIEAGINDFLNQHVNELIDLLNDNLNGQEVGFAINRTIDIKDLNGELSETTSEVEFRRYSAGCVVVDDEDVEAPGTGVNDASSTGFVARMSKMLLVPAALVVAGGAVFARKWLVRSRE